MEYIHLCLLLVLVILILLLLFKSNKQDKSSANILIQNEISNLNSQLANRLDNLNIRLGQIDEANRNLSEVSRDMANFQQKLLNPIIRGGIGEVILENLLKQILPKENFSIQHRFSNGERVDALITIADNTKLSIDAKFPMSNFHNLVKASSDEERKRCRKIFLQDVRKHIDDISKKYIRQAEGTLDYAFMYIPAENIYYEITANSDSDSIFDYSIERKVIPVSPNTLYAYLQTVSLGIRGLKIEKHVREVLERISQLRGDVNNLKDSFRTMGTHITNTHSSYIKTNESLTKLSTTLDIIESKTTEE